MIQGKIRANHPSGSHFHAGIAFTSTPRDFIVDESAVKSSAPASGPLVFTPTTYAEILAKNGAQLVIEPAAVDSLAASERAELVALRATMEAAASLHDKDQREIVALREQLAAAAEGLALADMKVNGTVADLARAVALRLSAAEARLFSIDAEYKGHDKPIPLPAADKPAKKGGEK